MKTIPLKSFKYTSFKLISLILFTLILIFSQKKVFAQITPLNNIGKEVYIDLGNFQRNGGVYIASNGLISNFKTQFPNYDGNLINVTFNEELISPQKIKDISILSGKSEDGKTQMKITLTENTLDGIMQTPEGYFFIEPIANSVNQFRIYAMSETNIDNLKCNVGDDFHQKKDENQATIKSISPFPVGGSLRKYRMAAAATGEFVSFYGSQANALSKIVSLLNAANLIFELEASIRFELINESINYGILFTNPSTDPFSPDPNFASAAASQNGFNNMNANGILPYSYYDVGHTFNIFTSSFISSQGQAGPSPCVDNFKSNGWTEWSNLATFPTYLSMVVRVFTHEVGHQFTAWHTFNAVGGPSESNPNFCLGGWSNTDAVEPGSGTTLMSYANNCVYPTNYTISGGNQLSYFNTKSLEKIYNYVNNQATCYTTSSTGNTPPVAYAGVDVSIPKGTPFKLNGTATDANGDIMTYTWEQFDVATVGDKGALGSSVSGLGGYPAVNSQTAPLFKSVQSASSTERFFPSLGYILNDANNPADNVGEDLPLVVRDMHFRFTVRDNRANGGGVDSDEVKVSVVTSGPFEITSQNSPTLWFYNGSNTANITWNVNGTDSPPLNTSHVKISFSTDGGQTFPIVLIGSTQNDGQYTVTIPNNITTRGRIKIEAIDNVYFDINNIDITIATACSPEESSIYPTSSVTEQAGSTNLNLNMSAFGVPINSFTGTIASTDPVTNITFNNGSGSCQRAGNSTYYDIFTFIPNTSGTYTFSFSGSAAGKIMTVYSDSYNALSPCTNWIGTSAVYSAPYVSTNNTTTVILAAYNVYKLVITGFSGVPATPSYSINITSSPAGTIVYSPLVLNPYDYTYLVKNNVSGNISGFTNTADLSNSSTYSHGDYTVYGLSFQGGLSLAPYIGTSFSSFQTLLANGTVCGKISANSKLVTLVPCTAPAAPNTTSVNRCGTGSAVLTASGCTGFYNWYAANTGGVSLASTASFTTPSVSSTTSYYVNCTVNACASSRSSATATINNIPSAPTTTSNARCGTGSVVLAAAGCTGTYNWYATSTGGVSLASTASFITPSLTSSTTAYFVDCTVSACVSSRSSATATINIIPSTPLVTVNSEIINSGQATTLNASGCNGVVKWYNQEIGGIELGIGTSFISPILYNPPSDSYSYFAECIENECPSLSRGAGTVSVNINPCQSLAYDLVSTLNDISSGTIKFEAGREIKAKNKITGSGKVKYDSGKYILLEQGFTADLGTVFEASIDGCGNN
ncbi:Ig-like domain-containing protein [Lacihabitans lacunae]|uniref:3-coathanger stack domain-containing protein n=1 Tax=Lacihabitans lacunae TaxID=1028214 RepID=A0ABV7Z1A8_9BACT